MGSESLAFVEIPWIVIVGVVVLGAVAVIGILTHLALSSGSATGKNWTAKHPDRYHRA